VDTLLEGRSKHRYVCRDVRDGVKGRLAHGKMFSLRTVQDGSKEHGRSGGIQLNGQGLRICTLPRRPKPDGI